MALRLVNSEPKRIDLGDGDFIDVRTEVSKRAFEEFAKYMPNDLKDDTEVTIQQGLAIQKALFAEFVVGWSLPVPPTVESYEKLENESSSVIDTALADHFNSLQGTPDSSVAPTATEAKKQKT